MAVRLLLKQKVGMPILRELLGAAAGVEKFHTFCYGWSTIIPSDHKPLISIVRKDLVNAPLRLQRLLLRLQKYDVTILYKPGKSMIFCRPSKQKYWSRKLKNPNSTRVKLRHIIIRIECQSV